MAGRGPAARDLGRGDGGLSEARRKARELWIAPGERPRGRYAPISGGRGNAAALYEKRKYAEKKAGREAS